VARAWLLTVDKGKDDDIAMHPIISLSSLCRIWFRSSDPVSQIINQRDKKEVWIPPVHVSRSITWHAAGGLPVPAGRVALVHVHAPQRTTTRQGRKANHPTTDHNVGVARWSNCPPVRFSRMVSWCSVMSVVSYRTILGCRMWWAYSYIAEPLWATYPPYHCRNMHVHLALINQRTGLG
jgi:hypothetical protein